MSLDRERGTANWKPLMPGMLGHAIEPAIRPLGFDWKIGIALITSFAAREVFVGTMATLYQRRHAMRPMMRRCAQRCAAARARTARPVYTLATGLSLLIFYVFAMQCMSTLAIVKRETRSWKWPLIQFVYMLAMAWAGAWVAYVMAK